MQAEFHAKVNLLIILAGALRLRRSAAQLGDLHSGTVFFPSSAAELLCEFLLTLQAPWGKVESEDTPRGAQRWSASGFTKTRDEQRVLVDGIAKQRRGRTRRDVRDIATGAPDKVCSPVWHQTDVLWSQRKV
ncbi:hypothetical protein OE88DRAFT_1651278 [Heliocybe sulcata]|uniref:Uncharacterized protein n=1 Tax=Heliocybe sulcata TaxID=5364 RepID=A0A5C3NM11_9AGAM|nr:hypothetical protein OE88DRAFT_1651278 [Heliocybe sulcata]